MITQGSSVRTETVTERGWTDLELTDKQAATLQQLRFCSVTPTGTTGIWRIADVSHIGVASLPDLRIRVQPKTPLENILFLASYAGQQVHLQRSVSYAEEDGLPTALAGAFIAAVEACTIGGPLKGYSRVEETGNVVRGRWDIPRQLRRRPGIPLPLELTVDRFTPDIPENQVLLAALRRLTKTPVLTIPMRRRLNGTMAGFDEVTEWRGRGVPDIPNTRLNRHYAFALTLARLILEATSWTHRAGRSEGASFLISMPALFEQFVHRALSEQFRPLGITIAEQDTSFVLDTGGQVKLRPDLVFRQHDHVLGIADLKYKTWNADAGSPPNADVYQAVAYALAAGIGSAHLLYVSGDVRPAQYTIESAGKTVIAHTIDLSGSPGEMLDSIRRAGRELMAARRAGWPIIHDP